jgi:hypothetical protein
MLHLIFHPFIVQKIPFANAFEDCRQRKKCGVRCSPRKIELAFDGGFCILSSFNYATLNHIVTE